MRRSRAFAGLYFVLCSLLGGRHVSLQAEQGLKRSIEGPVCHCADIEEAFSVAGELHDSVVLLTGATGALPTSDRRRWEQPELAMRDSRQSVKRTC